MSTEAAKRFRAALDMAETGVEMMRASLRRRHPDASAAEVDRLLRNWLVDRPPDCPGRSRQIPAA